MENSYIVYQHKVSRQLIGIPMGINCAPDITNIYVHVFECNYIYALVASENLDLDAALSNMFRFQDDLIFDNGALFQTVIGDIYPIVMELKNTNLSPQKVNNLDMTISVHRGRYLYKSFEKSNDFGFYIINYPDLRGNAPKSLAYGLFISQLVHFSVINKSVQNFKRDVGILIKKLLAKVFTKVETEREN